MARHEEQWEADEARFERLNERPEDEAADPQPVLHDHPHYNLRTDESRFPCGLDSHTPGERIAWDLFDINCPGCLEARRARDEERRVCERANELWLAMTFEERVAFEASREDWHPELYRRARRSLGLEVRS